MWAVFDKEDESKRHPKDKERPRESMYNYPLGIALEWLVQHLLREAGGGALPRVLVGDSDMFDMKRITSNEDIAKMLRSLVVFGTNNRAKLPRKGLSKDACLQFVRERFDRIILPYNVNNYHFLVFEIVYEVEEPQLPYIKIWDSYDLWGHNDVNDIRELEYLSASFFYEGEKVAFFTQREEWEPNQGHSTACAAFTFMTSAFLACGQEPPAAKVTDDGFLRNYMWGCCVKGRLLPLPQVKLM